MLEPAPSRTVRQPSVVPGLVVAGFDPGITSPAITCTRRKPGGGYEYVDHAVIRTNTSDRDLDRYDQIFDEVSRLLIVHRPSLFVLEEQRTTQVGKQRDGEFNANNGKTLIVFGAALGAARAYRIPREEVHPKRVKIAVLGKGNGAADKKQVQAIVEKVLGKKLPQDAADAAAMSIYGHRIWRAR